jgi:predicted nucleic acid-binding protein
MQLDDLADEIVLFGTYVSFVPSVYLHPHDPDDSHYVDLAIAANCTLIISRDRHLLDLMDKSQANGMNFKTHFPNLAILTPEDLIQKLRAEARR